MDNLELLKAIQSMADELKNFKTEITENIQSIKADNSTIHNDLQSIRQENVTIHDDLQSMKADVARLPQMEKNISLLMEGQKGMNEQLKKLDRLSDDMEDVKIKVSALEEATRSNSSQIKELRIAK